MPRLLLLLVLAAFASAPSLAQTCSTSWENPVDGDWDDASKWTDGVPTGSTSAGGIDPCITVDGTYTVTIRPDYAVNVNLNTLTLGGASGTQTLVSGGYIRLTDLSIGARGRMEMIPGTVGGIFRGLEASGTVLVEGFLSKNSNTGVFLNNAGDVEVASGGVLRGTNGTRLGGPNGTFTIRGTAELSDGARIDARAEILEGTVRATSGTGELFVSGGGILRDATLDAASGANLIIGGSYALEGTLSGSPQGGVYFHRGTHTADAFGVTLAMTGTGIQFGLPPGQVAQFNTTLTGGPVLNTGRLAMGYGLGFLRGLELTNEGELENEANILLSDGAVIRNRPGGVIRMVDSQFSQNPNTSVVRIVNEGLIVREDPGGANFARFVNVTLESLPGSEIRTFGDYLDLAGQTDALPPGMMLTGDGLLRMAGLPIRSTFSPGTEAEPIGTLGPRSLDTFVLAPEAITILDVDAGGVSDRIIDNIGRGANVTLGGTLRVRVRPGFTPSVGDAWTIAVNGPNPVQGAFSAVEVEGGPPGLSFVVDTSQPGAAVLRAVASVSVSAPLASAQEGTPTSFVLSHPSSPNAFSINVETGGTATLFSDYTIGATRGVVRAQANTTQTTVQVFPRRDADAAEGDETLTLRVVQGLDAAPGATPEASLTILDGPSNAELAVDGISPARGSNAGIVTATIYGSALTDDATVRLVGPGTIVGERVAAFAQSGGLRATFDLRGAATGDYDVEVTDNGTVTLAGAFRVTADAVEFPIWGAIDGTPAPRLGRYSTYTITIGNDGSVDLFDTLVNLRITGAQEYSIQQISKVLGFENEPDGVEIGGQDIVPIYIYKLPAGDHVQFSVRVKPGVAGEPLYVAYQLHRPNPQASYTISGDFGDLATDTDAGLVTYLGVMSGYMNRFLSTPTPPAYASSTSSRPIIICPPPPPVPTPSWFDTDEELLTEVDEDDPVYELGQGLFGDRSPPIRTVPVGSGGVSGHQVTGTLGQLGQLINTLPTPEQVEQGTLGTIGNLLNTIPGMRRSNRRSASLRATTEGGPIGITGSCAGGIVGASGDPNDKLGPFGVLAERYTRPTRSAVPYTIRFENMPTASFPAQEVIVVDTLDTAVFDLSTFAFGPITWGEMGRLTPPAGAQSFEAEVDLSPELAATLLVTAALDPVSGRAEWHFVTLDPNTGALPENGLIGFLPPNTSSPGGEGALQFTVKTREGLTTGTEVSNSAEIIFDVNEPIRTPIWTNTVDVTAPVSSVQPLAGTEVNPVRLTLSGSDAGSGIEAYAVYASQDEGPFEIVGLTDDPTFEFEGDVGSTYGFYSIAYDAVDNLEGAKTSAEATTVVLVDVESGPDLPRVLTLEAPRPNPAVELVRLRYGMPRAGDASVRVLDALGREVTTLVSGDSEAGWHTVEWQPNVASGVYVVELRAGDAVRHQRVTVVR